MNHNGKKISKRTSKILALTIFAVAIFALSSSVNCYFRSDYLNPKIPLDPDIIGTMRSIIRVETFEIMPSMSVMLILCAHLIWKLSNRIDDDKAPRQ
jgi:hypothetical protein